MSKLIGIFLIIFSVTLGGYLWRQSDQAESAMLIRRGSNKMTILQGSKKITANSNQNSFLTKGLVGMWSFNGYDVTDKIYDRSGQNNNGYFGTSTATTSAKIMGKVGQALNFNTDYVNIPSSSSLQIPSKLTISAWIRPISNTSDMVIVQKRNTAVAANEYNYGFWVNITTGKLFFQYNDGAYENFTDTGAAPPLNKWTLVTVVADEVANTTTFYQNGILSSSLSNTTAMPSSGVAPVEIGGYVPFGFIYFFKGSIDEVRVYNRALSADEVMSLWQTGR